MKKSWVCYKQIFAAFALFAAKVVPSFFLATRYSSLVPVSYVAWMKRNGIRGALFPDFYINLFSRRSAENAE